MPAVVVTNAGFCRLIWTQGGVPYAVNVLGIQNTATVTITQTLTNTVGTAIKASLASSQLNAQLGPTIALSQIGLRSIHVANQPEFLDSGSPAPGTATGDVLPPQVSLCVTLRTALAGRSFRGRVFLPGFAESANGAAGAANAAVGTAAAAFLNAVNNNLSTSGLQMAIVSRPVHDAAGAVIRAGFVTAVITGGIVVRDLVWDTQRRRAIPGI